VLKNTLRNHVIALRAINNQELIQVKLALLEFLVSQPNMNGSISCSRKLIKEAIFVITRVVVQEFMNAD
jgi:hypothetical protein